MQGKLSGVVYFSYCLLPTMFKGMNSGCYGYSQVFDSLNHLAVWGTVFDVSKTFFMICDFVFHLIFLNIKLFHVSL